MISYEIAMGLSVIPVFLLVGSLNLSDVIRYQTGSVFNWLIFKQPLAFAIFMAAMFAETNRLPFDLPESEQELAGGYNVEYSSIKFALFFMARVRGHDGCGRDDGDAVPGRLDPALRRTGPARAEYLGGVAADRNFPRQDGVRRVHDHLGALDVAAVPL